MIIDNLDAGRSSASPDKTQPPLLVDADAVLAMTITAQGFEAVIGWNSEILERCCAVKHGQFAHGDTFDIHESTTAFAIEQGFGLSTSEGLNRHETIVTTDDSIVNRYIVSEQPRVRMIFVGCPYAGDEGCSVVEALFVGDVASTYSGMVASQVFRPASTRLGRQVCVGSQGRTTAAAPPVMTRRTGVCRCSLRVW